MLICVGSAVFTVVSIFGFPGSDPSRVAAGIVTGIGFIGAGLIIFHQNKVHGLTTAAALWVMAAIGVAIGMEYYFLAAFGTAIIMIVLFGFRVLKLEERIHKINRP